MKTCQLLGLIGLLFLSPILGQANVTVLPRNIEHLRQFQTIGTLETSGETSVAVRDTHLAYVNYEALRFDFPKLREYSNEQIDQLLLENFSFISDRQLQMGELRNTAIPTVPGKSKLAYRPGGYERADVMYMHDFDGTKLGLVDRKGTGVGAGALSTNIDRSRSLILSAEQIEIMDHSDGLMSLGETIVETTRQKARQKLFKIENTGHETIETYFVLSLPFSIKKGSGQSVPAAIYARQAHIGRSYSFDTPLRQERDAAQSDYFLNAIDHGMVKILDSRLKNTFTAYGYDDPQTMADWAWAHDTATAFHNSKDRAIVSRHIADMLAPIAHLNIEEVNFQNERPEFKQEVLNFIIPVIQNNLVGKKNQQSFYSAANRLLTYMTANPLIWTDPNFVQLLNSIKDTNHLLSHSAAVFLENLEDAGSGCSAWLK